MKMKITYMEPQKPIDYAGRVVAWIALGVCALGLIAIGKWLIFKII